MSDSTFTLSRDDDPVAGVVLSMSGRLDAVTALDLRAAVSELEHERPQPVRADLTELGFVDSAGLAALVALHRQCERTGSALTFLPPRSPEATRVFELTGFDRLFGFRADRRG